MFRAMALEGVLVEMGRLENAMKKRLQSGCCEDEENFA